jgi:hypothetical protein
MERRYLVAALAIIATFAVVSRGFRTLEHMSCLHGHSFGSIAASVPRPAARMMARVRTHFHPASPKEAQLLAEMNVPVAGMAEQMDRQESATDCARAKAMRDMERVQRDAARMQNKMTHISLSPETISMDINLPPDFDQRIQQQTAAAMAEANVRLQVAADKLRESSMQMAEAESSAASMEESAPIHVVTHVRCNVASIQQQTRQAVRDALRQVQLGFVAK